MIIFPLTVVPTGICPTFWAIKMTWFLTLNTYLFVWKLTGLHNVFVCIYFTISQRTDFRAGLLACWGSLWNYGINAKASLLKISHTDVRKQGQARLFCIFLLNRQISAVTGKMVMWNCICAPPPCLDNSHVHIRASPNMRHVLVGSVNYF